MGKGANIAGPAARNDTKHKHRAAALFAALWPSLLGPEHGSDWRLRNRQVWRRRMAHVSGHGCQEELLTMLNLTKPEYFMPVHGEYRMLVQHANLAQQTGIDAARIFVVENGDAIQFTPSSAQRVGRIYGGPVYVDGLGVGDVGEVVLRDRKHLSIDGMLVVTVTVDSMDGKVLAGPDITTRGFAYGEGALLDDVRHAAADIMESGAREGLTEWTAIREHVHKGLQKFIYDRTKRRPMIVPVVMEV